MVKKKASASKPARKSPAKTATKKTTGKKRTKKKRRSNNSTQAAGKKRIALLVILIIIVLAAIFTRGCVLKHKSYDTKVAVGYLPVWDYTAYKSVDMSKLTHINIAFCNPDSEGRISCSISDDQLKKIVKKAHKYGVKVQASLGGGGGSTGYTKLTSDRSSRKQFDKNIVSFVKEHNMDGVDINIEGDVDKSFWKNYDSWVQDLDKRLNRSGLGLSCASATWFADRIKKSTFEYFDFVSVMAYDNRGDSNPSSLAHSRSCLKYFSRSKDVPPEKLVLGIPLYGYYYENGYCTSTVKAFGSILRENPGAEKKDKINGWRYNGFGTVSKKAELASDYGGVMFWALGQDSVGKKSLVNRTCDDLKEFVQKKEK